MISSNSTWDRKNSVKYRSPAFTYGGGKVTFEFDNRRSSKIFSHKLGRVTFTSGSDSERTKGRNEQIDSVYGVRSIDGYTYKSVSHVHIQPVLLTDDLYVYGHGVIVKGGWENCKLAGSECESGYGTSTKCEVGKCRIGQVVRVSGDKWRYESLTVPGLYYFVFGTEQVTLKSITKGRFVLPAGVGEINVNRVASIPATVYLPPNTYSTESFTRRVIYGYSSNENLVSLTDSVDNFVRSLIGLNQATVQVERELYDRVLSAIRSVLDPAWYEFVLDVISDVWTNRYVGNNISNREFLVRCYNVLTDLYGRGVQVAMSGLRGSKLVVDDNIGRPVYGRLPGVEGKYNDGEGGDTAAKWLTAGSDDLLSTSKTLIDNFYRYFLDPETCYPLNLDWLAQHVGFMGGLWNIDWPQAVKRKMLINAHVNRVTEGGMWTLNPENDTLRGVDFSRIETLSVNGSVVSLENKYFKKVYDSDTDITSIVAVPGLIADVSQWQGILPSKGNMQTLLFVLSTLGIKSHDPSELVYNATDNTFNVRDGMRSVEINSPVLTPYSVDVLHVGDEVDAEVSNFSNQLIADVSTCQDELSANTIVFRMPFYYNRNGRSWDSTKQVVENYVPSTSVAKVQYAYPAADLLVAEDVFFELPSIDTPETGFQVPEGEMVIELDGFSEPTVLVTESDSVLLVEG